MRIEIFDKSKVWKQNALSNLESAKQNSTLEDAFFVPRPSTGGKLSPKVTDEVSFIARKWRYGACGISCDKI